ncbi:unnamed protein product [Polarella glacialis]|uniref:Ion transport domain-containing protein n=1 Tax=Polarella glacialis TaxID=89957 RepID=A0A813F3E8_POLGL|nr:unnamed protein product [Polarella glacialis]
MLSRWVAGLKNSSRPSSSYAPAAGDEHIDTSYLDLEDHDTDCDHRPQFDETVLKGGPAFFCINKVRCPMRSPRLFKLRSGLLDDEASSQKPVRLNYSFNVAHCENDLSGELGDDQTSCRTRCRRRLVIRPELMEDRKANGHVHWVELWDLFIAALLFFCAYYVSFECVADKNHHSVLRAVFNRSLTVIFTVDIVMNFFIAYSNPTGDLSRSLWEMDPWLIASRYMAFPMSQGKDSGWFWIDVVSTFPGWLHFYWMLVYGDPCEHTLKGLELLRALKLYRMLNLTRLQRFVSRWQAAVGFSYHLVDILKFIVVTALAAHWFACGWVAIEGKVGVLTCMALCDAIAAASSEFVPFREVLCQHVENPIQTVSPGSGQMVRDGADPFRRW